MTSGLMSAPKILPSLFGVVDTHIAGQVQNPDTNQRLGGVLALVLQIIPPWPALLALSLGR